MAAIRRRTKEPYIRSQHLGLAMGHALLACISFLMMVVASYGTEMAARSYAGRDGLLALGWTIKVVTIGATIFFVQRTRRHLATARMYHAIPDDGPKLLFLRPFNVARTGHYTSRELGSIQQALRLAFYRTVGNRIIDVFGSRLTDVDRLVRQRHQGCDKTVIRRKCRHAKQLLARHRFLSITNPSEDLANDFGPVALEDDEWQAEVAQYMKEAYLVVLVYDDSAGVMWELDRLIADGHLEKLLILLPMTEPRRRACLHRLSHRLGWDEATMLHFADHRMIGVTYGEGRPFAVPGKFGARNGGIREWFHLWFTRGVIFDCWGEDLLLRMTYALPFDTPSFIDWATVLGNQVKGRLLAHVIADPQ